MTAKNVLHRLKELSDPHKASLYLRFFKTGNGQYGQGDQFLGLTNPKIHSVVREYKQLPLNEVAQLIQNPFHEARVTAALILVDQYQKADENGKAEIFKLYCQSFKFINNWDIVDLSAYKITGDYIFNHPNLQTKINTWIKSKHLWTRRIGVMSTFTYIRKNQFDLTINICEQLLNDSHDLIHKATGWMLREVGKRDIDVLIDFLDKYATKMPRTMLRYAIEKLPELKRRYYLEKKD